jgi:hypothetical protein
MPRRHRDLKSFEQEVDAGGGMSARADAGTQPVPVEKIVGSVGRARSLRSDFFYRGARAMTYRYRRIGELMEEGRMLPPIHVYRLRRRHADAESSPESEYYVVDGHHRVAMARKLGQAYLDASIVEYQVGGTADAAEAPPVDSGDASGMQSDETGRD